MTLEEETNIIILLPPALTWREPFEQAAGDLLQLLRLRERIHGSDDDAVAASASGHQHLHITACKRNSN